MSVGQYVTQPCDSTSNTHPIIGENVACNIPPYDFREHKSRLDFTITGK